MDNSPKDGEHVTPIWPRMLLKVGERHMHVFGPHDANDQMADCSRACQ